MTWLPDLVPSIAVGWREPTGRESGWERAKRGGQVCRDDREREEEIKERDINSELRDTHEAQAGGRLWEWGDKAFFVLSAMFHLFTRGLKHQTQT